MVKVKPAMSTDSSEGESDALAAVKDKLKIQQRLIDISARSLLSSRSSTADLSQSFESQSALEVQKENIALLENRLMKYFSRQLLLKHRFLQQVDCESPRGAERELNGLIDLGLFLSVADLEPRSIQLLLGEELALDVLYSMSPVQLQQLVSQLGLPVEEEGRLIASLKLLSSCYQQQEKEILDKATSDRYLSTSSRLSSVSTLSSIDQEGRHDSWSSTANPSSAASISNAGSVFTLTSPRPYTAISTAQSLLSPSPCPVNGGPAHHSTPAPQSPTLSRNTSLSSSVLYSEADSVDGSISSVSSYRGHRRRYSHMRSHSNPHAHLIMPDGEQQRNPAHPASKPEQAAYRSPSPPHRAGSHPSAHTTQGSPSSLQRRGHVHMRRLLPSSVPGSSDHLGPGGMMAAPDSPVQKGPTYPEYPIRSNSVTHTDRRASSSSYQSQHQKLHHGVTSTSMVDLPNTYATSTEHLDQIEEYPLSSNTAKSQSVPRLTLLTVSAESEKNGQSTSVPTSPRTPGTYTPTGHMGHAIKHRFTAKSFLTPHVCAVCRKTMVFGVRCKHCSYRCHKACAEKAPHSCGLPRELMNYFRQQFLNKTSPSTSFDNIISSTEPYSARPGMRRGSTYDADTREKDAEDDFIIPELTKEPTKGQYSPVMSQKKPQPGPTENGRTTFTAQYSSPSLLEVPITRSHHGGFRSISSSPSPSSSPPTSPSLSPSSPRSPRSPNGPYNAYTYPKPPDVVYTDDSENESCDGEPLIQACNLPRSRSPSPFGSKDSISDMERMKSVSPKGLRPPPQVVPAHSLPDLLLGHKSMENSEDSSVGSNGYSDHQRVRKKESLLSASDSRGSTLVNSIPSQAEEEDPYTESYDSSQGPPDDIMDFKIRHRGSVVDEWNIPYDEVRIVEKVGRGPMGEVFRGYWHGEVAIKRFCLDNAPKEHLKKFTEEVSILKKTRHTNLALFMGASLTLPNLAIISSFCRGHTLHKHLHIWSDVFSVEKCINIGKQIATGMGYLHARGIVHKGLHTRNVFLDKDKVVITDTGLSSLSDTLSCSRSTGGSGCRSVMPRTKLYYMAPELVREISTIPQVLENGDLFHYTEKTDVYAFGTVFYELLTRRYPFSSRDATGYPLTVTNLIYLVGKGCRQEVSSRDASKRLKDLIWDCWNPDPKLRVPFSTIWDILSKVSRKKTPIARSPSVPTALSRSSEDLLRLTFL